MDTGTILAIVTLVALGIVLVALVVVIRRRGAGGVDPETLRAALADALAAQAQNQSTGGRRHAARESSSPVGPTSSATSTAPSDAPAVSATPTPASSTSTRPQAAVPQTAAGPPTAALGTTTHEKALPEATALETLAGDATSKAGLEARLAVPTTSATAVPAAPGPGADAPAVILADLARQRRELESERHALDEQRARAAAGADAMNEERRRLATDRERLHADRADIDRQRDDLSAREQALRQRMTAADARQVALDQARLEVDAAQLELDEGRAELTAQRAELRNAHDAELARISSLTVQEARAELLQNQEDAVRRDAAMLIRRIETDAQNTAKTRARRIVADAIQRIASDQTSQSVVSVMHLPSDELKGRIIGREGRNIRAFETVTGVNVIVDDTPESVLLSCFDPVRREIGRVTLQMLIDDGRIHPHRIEEAYERAQEEVEALCARAAEDALLEVGVTDLHPDLVTLIGQLKYRSSYGQNVLGHLIETSHIARMMAAEIGIDPTITARGAFLHDIGKALTHEAQGSHAIVGAEIARKYGESQDVVHCIEAHHDEVPPATIEAVLTQAADACSGGRPGARRESLESYVKRLEHIEAIASAKKGVDKVFAMQAGRELRVMVKPDLVDDIEAHVMAREVAKQIEEELTYPGQVRVTVIRESRATEVAR